MIEFNYTPPDGTSQRLHASRQVGARAIPQRQPQQRNVEQILSLGDVRYMGYRNQAFRVPPVPYKLGQKVLDTHIRVLTHAKKVARGGTKEDSDQYFTELSYLVGLLWKHIRPTGKMRRLFWHLGLLSNPFRQASEKEVNEVTDFFLKGRMTSSVRSISEAAIQ